MVADEDEGPQDEGIVNMDDTRAYLYANIMFFLGKEQQQSGERGLSCKKKTFQKAKGEGDQEVMCRMQHFARKVQWKEGGASKLPGVQGFITIKDSGF